MIHFVSLHPVLCLCPLSLLPCLSSYSPIPYLLPRILQVKSWGGLATVGEGRGRSFLLNKVQRPLPPFPSRYRSETSQKSTRFVIIRYIRGIFGKFKAKSPPPIPSPSPSLSRSLVKVHTFELIYISIILSTLYLVTKYYIFSLNCSY